MRRRERIRRGRGEYEGEEKGEEEKGEEEREEEGGEEGKKEEEKFNTKTEISFFFVCLFLATSTEGQARCPCTSLSVTVSSPPKRLDCLWSPHNLLPGFFPRRKASRA
jgi:hypothetical protein